MSPSDIRDARIAAGLTQREAARTAGVSVQAWRSWEQGWRRPHGLYLRALLTAFTVLRGSQPEEAR